MHWIAWVYVGGIAAYIIVSHGMVQSQLIKQDTNPSDAILGAILWPLLVAIRPFTRGRK